MKREKMELKDLENGMVVEYRSGERRLVLDKILLDERLDITIRLSSYNANMTHYEYENLDICKVYTNYEAVKYPRRNFDSYVLWERPDEVDWSKVEVDTPIMVKFRRDCKEESKRYFACYENGKVYAWTDGMTSWSSNGEMTSWYCGRLATEEDGIVVNK